MQIRVELHGLTLTGECFDHSGHRVAAEEQVRNPAQLDGLDGLANVVVVQQHTHLGPSRDVQPGLDHAVISDRDADTGVRPQQGALSDDDLLCATTREGAHDAGATTDVAAVTDDDTCGDAAFDHACAERAGVEVDEALVHDGRSGRQVRTQTHPRGVSDAH